MFATSQFAWISPCCCLLLLSGTLLIPIWCYNPIDQLYYKKTFHLKSSPYWCLLLTPSMGTVVLNVSQTIDGH